MHPLQEGFHETRGDGDRPRRGARAGGSPASASTSSERGRDGAERAPARRAATQLTIWVGWSARELSEFKKVVAEYDRKNPDVTVKVVGSINDDKIIASLRAGNAADVVSSFTSQNVGIYCKSGGWIDLAPYLKRDKIDMSQFPAATRYYTQYQGTRCALPLLADVYGFYYNKKLFREAGLTGPPKTLRAADRLREEADEEERGRLAEAWSASTRSSASTRTPPGVYQPLVGAKYFDKAGKSALARTPRGSGS